MSTASQSTQHLPISPTPASEKRPLGAGAPGLQLALRASSDQGDELTKLLAQRLKLVGWVMIAVLLVGMLADALGAWRPGEPWLRRHLGEVWVWFNLSHCLGYVFGLLCLRCMPTLGLSGLRLLEAWIWGVLVAFNVYGSWVTVNALLDAGVSTGASWRTALSPWLLVITGYGTLIPNEMRRCAVVVCSMAALIIGLLVVALLRHDLGTLIMLRIALYMSVPIVLALAIAIVGSHRLERLRQESQLARRMGQYKLVRQLGAGGMGEVYLAEHVLLRRQCAVKSIKPGQGTESQLARFEREVQATATLSHPNTVHIFDFGHAQDGTFYYAMEYLPGLTLEDLVEKHGPLEPARTVHFLRQLCGSLREAHGIGLIHRDIKPGNVMVTRRGGLADVIKLLDFGLVISADESASDARLTQEGMMAGTPAFVSPEQARGAASLDGRSDIYALGALGWYLLVGRPLFGERTPAATLAAHIYEAPTPLRSLRSEVPAALEAVIMRCLAKDPEQRYPDVHTLDLALAAALDRSAWSEVEAEACWAKSDEVLPM